ncbi:hypothetical protein MHZ93_00580 [Roseomonas sp. ACRSG]|nr:hypothetical protein [Roseomonas sp. ACRSG]
MAERQVRREALFYGFNLEEHVSADGLLRHLAPLCCRRRMAGMPGADPAFDLALAFDDRLRFRSLSCLGQSMSRLPAGCSHDFRHSHLGAIGPI